MRTPAPSPRSASPPPRLGRLELVSWEGAGFLALVAEHARSADHGVIGSQYEAELRAGDPAVSCRVLTACGQPVAGVSWGYVELPRGGVASRLDVVFVDAELRGHRLGRLAMAAWMHTSLEEHPDRLRLLTTIAVHPAVQALCERFELRREPSAPYPLHQRRLDPEARRLLGRTLRFTYQQQLGALRMRCQHCKRHRWAEPWCEAAR